MNDPLYSLFENLDRNAAFQKAKASDNSNTWNILVQILLPIVFVSAFALTSLLLLLLNLTILHYYKIYLYRNLLIMFGLKTSRF